jgi:hypothetical protein
MDNYKSLKLGYRMMQIALAMACFTFVYTLYNYQRNAERDNQILSKHNELIISSQKTLDEIHRQHTAAGELVAASQGRLSAAEKRQAAEKAGASQKAP